MRIAQRSESQDFSVFRSFWFAFLLIGSIHFLIYGILHNGWWFEFRKVPEEITIELSGSLPTGGGGQSENPGSGQSTGPVPVPEPRVRPKVLARPQAQAPDKTRRPTIRQPLEERGRPVEDESSTQESQSVTRESPQAKNTGGGSRLKGTPAANTVDATYDAANLKNPKPPYPPLAFQLRVEGTVIVKVHVLADGSASELHLGKSSGNRLLDDSALSTIGKWRFNPASHEGKSHDQWIEVPIRFKIKENPLPERN